MLEGRLGRFFGRSPKDSFYRIGSDRGSFFNVDDMRKRREVLDEQMRWIKEQEEIREALKQRKHDEANNAAVTVPLIRDGREFIVELEESPTRNALTITSKSYERDGILYPERTEGLQYDPSDNSLNIGSTFSFHGNGVLAVVSDGNTRAMRFNGQLLPTVFQDLQDASNVIQPQLQAA